MYKTIIETIKQKFEEIPQIQEVFDYPEGQGTSISAYPAVVILPDDLTSTFSTNADNHRVLQFKVWAIAQTSQVELQTLWTNIMPNLIDAILDKFDTGWDFGTNSGHRIWARMSTGRWSMATEQSSVTATVEMTLVVRFDKSI